MIKFFNLNGKKHKIIKIIEEKFKILFFLFLPFVCRDVQGTNGGILVEQSNSMFNFFNGQASGILATVGLLAATGLTLIMSSVKPLLIGGSALAFLFVMKGWTATTYSALI